MNLAPVILTLTVVALPLIARFAVLQRLMNLNAAGMAALLGNPLGPQGCAWLGFAVAVKLFGLLLLRPLEGRPRMIAWSVLRSWSGPWR